MRKLWIVPIVHSPADMGTMAGALAETSAAALGREVWDRHLQTVAGFWQSIAHFFQYEAVNITKIYQDGLIAAGEDGLKIIHEGVRQGSSNYRIISGLLLKGAELVKTEDVTLVQKEYNFIKKLTSAKSARERETANLRYKLAQHKLLEARDIFIAVTIAGTLKPSDTGVLFIGAYHDVLARLPSDIHIIQIKEVTKVREYHSLLRNIGVKTGTRYQQLAKYLAAPVSIDATG